MKNEPTTGEIVRALREDCNVLDYNADKFAAADRLESQEKTIATLTARAESAERERDDYKQELKDALKNHS